MKLDRQKYPHFQLNIQVIIIIIVNFIIINTNNNTGNDERYVKYVNDIRFSVFESLIRSISHRKIELHRKVRIYYNGLYLYIIIINNVLHLVSKSRKFKRLHGSHYTFL